MVSSGRPPARFTWSVMLLSCIVVTSVTSCGSRPSVERVDTTAATTSSAADATSTVSASPTSTTVIVPSSTVAPTTTLTDVDTIAMADVQLALLVAGLEPGPADGVRTARTAAAISEFQSLRSLPTTGVVDAATAAALGKVLASRPGRVVVRLSTQRAEVYDREGALIGVWLVSTGKRGNWTPKGRYFVNRKLRTITFTGGERDRADWFTAFYGTFGFHGIPWIGTRDNRVPTALGIEPQSHGCVRMHDELARFLYERLPFRARVDIVQ